jgi:predicted lipoprotein
LSAHARVHTGDAARVAGTVNVASTESDRGQARVDIGEGVVVVGYVEFTLVLCGVVV